MTSKRAINKIVSQEWNKLKPSKDQVSLVHKIMNSHYLTNQKINGTFLFSDTNETQPDNLWGTQSSFSITGDAKRFYHHANSFLSSFIFSLKIPDNYNYSLKNGNKRGDDLLKYPGFDYKPNKFVIKISLETEPDYKPFETINVTVNNVGEKK